MRFMSRCRKASRNIRQRFPQQVLSAKEAGASLSAAKAPPICSVIDDSGTVYSTADQVHGLLLGQFKQLMGPNNPEPVNVNAVGGDEQPVVSPSAELLNAPVTTLKLQRIIVSARCRWITAPDYHGCSEGLFRVACAFSNGMSLLDVISALFTAMLRLETVPDFLKDFIFFFTFIITHSITRMHNLQRTESRAT